MELVVEGLTFHGPFEPGDLEHVVSRFESIFSDGHYLIIVNIRDMPALCPAAAILLGEMAARCREHDGALVLAEPPPHLLPLLSTDEDLRTIRWFETEKAALRHLGGDGPGHAGIPCRLRRH